MIHLLQKHQARVYILKKDTILPKWYSKSVVMGAIMYEGSIKPFNVRCYGAP